MMRDLISKWSGATLLAAGAMAMALLAVAFLISPPPR